MRQKKQWVLNEMALPKRKGETAILERPALEKGAHRNTGAHPLYTVRPIFIPLAIQPDPFEGASRYLYVRPLAFDVGKFRTM